MKITVDKRPEVTRIGILDMQVCVPQEWTDAMVESYAGRENPSGVRSGWQVRTDKKLLGGPIRCPYEEREGLVHITFDR
jgi:hypothetical protein